MKWLARDAPWPEHGFERLTHSLPVGPRSSSSISLSTAVLGSWTGSLWARHHRWAHLHGFKNWEAFWCLEMLEAGLPGPSFREKCRVLLSWSKRLSSSPQSPPGLPESLCHLPGPSGTCPARDPIAPTIHPLLCTFSDTLTQFSTFPIFFPSCHSLGSGQNFVFADSFMC